MGPNAKKRSRKQYIKYRLSVLEELHINPPADDVIQRMYDEDKMSEIEVDSIFLGCIKKSR